MAYFAGDAGQHTVEGDAGLLAMAMSLSEAGHFSRTSALGQKLMERSASWSLSARSGHWLTKRAVYYVQSHL